MKKFILKRGKGSVCEIRIIYKTLTTKAENIDDVNPLEILPDSIKRKVPYVRKIHTSETKRNYDYGSWGGLLKQKKMKRTDTYINYLTKLTFSNTNNVFKAYL